MFEGLTAGPERQGPTPAKRCEAMAVKGDLLGLLDFLETQANPILLHESLGTIGRCIRVRACEDLSGLSEDAFARILGMAILLLTKVQLFIMTRLQEAEQMGAHTLSQLPKDITDDGWLERMERLSRFVAEMAATRARVRHLNGLSDDSIRSRRSRRRSRSAATLAKDRDQAAGGKGPSGNGWVRRQAASSRLSDRLGGSLPRTQQVSMPPEVDLPGAAGTGQEGLEADPVLAG